MKIFILVILLVGFIEDTNAIDVIRLKNNGQLAGNIIKQKRNKLFLQIDTITYKIPKKDIHEVIYGYNAIPKDLVDQLSTEDKIKCMKAIKDAQTFHGKNGLHMLLGALTGPVSIIATALANPTPPKGNRTYLLSQNKELFNDPVYLNVYKRTAKKKLITQEVTGMLICVMTVLAIVLSENAM